MSRRFAWLLSAFRVGVVVERWRALEMNESAAPVTIVLRIPGKWSHPSELLQRLPDGCRLTPEALVLPDATQVGFGAMTADDQFAPIFRSSCRQPAAEDELETVDGDVTAHGPPLAGLRRITSNGAADATAPCSDRATRDTLSPQRPTTTSRGGRCKRRH